MKLFAVKYTFYIEGYYSVTKISKIFSTAKKAQEYIDYCQENLLRANWVKFLVRRYEDELSKTHKEKIAELSEARSKAYDTEKPRYFGDQRDKVALAQHHEVKALWLKSVTEAGEAHQNFVWDNVYEPARIRAKAARDTEIPDDLLDEVKEYGDEPTKYEIEEIEIDPDYRNDDNVETD